MKPQTHQPLQTRPDLSRPGLTAFFNICGKWGLMNRPGFSGGHFV